MADASSIATLTAQVTALQQQFKQQLDTLTKVVETIRNDVKDVKQQQQQFKQQLGTLTKVVETISSDVTEIKEIFPF